MDHLKVFDTHQGGQIPILCTLPKSIQPMYIMQRPGTRERDPIMNGQSNESVKQSARLVPGTASE